MMRNKIPKIHIETFMKMIMITKKKNINEIFKFKSKLTKIEKRMVYLMKFVT